MIDQLIDQVQLGFKTTKDRLNALHSPTLRLGVTGLTRAGKTVFITSLVQNLISRKNLPFFSANACGRIKAIYLEPQADDHLPRFAIEDHRQNLLNDPPSWPRATGRLSQLRLTIDYEPINRVKQALAYHKLHIDIIDYPGEWLLDLQLLDMTYGEWAAQSLTTAKALSHVKDAATWLTFCQTIDPLGPLDELLAKELAAQFTKFMQGARQSADNLITLPPGRFLTPGDMAGSPALTFAPLLWPKNTDLADVPDNCLLQLMIKRYDAYKTHIVKPFYYDHFTRLDRQIVLVDVLDSLNKGSNALKRLRDSMEDILKHFDIGKSHWLTALWRRPVDRVIFAATKADHIHHSSHKALEQLLNQLVGEAKKRADYKGANIYTMALASLRATEEGEIHENNQTMPCIIGTPQKGETVNEKLYDGTEQIAFFSGDLSTKLDDYLKEHEENSNNKKPFHFLKFAPPKLEQDLDAPAQSLSLPHMRLDRIIDLILEDYLQ